MRTASSVLLVLLVMVSAPSYGLDRTREEGAVLARILVSEDTRVIRDRQPDCKASCGTGGVLTPDAHAIAEVVVNNRVRFPKEGTFLGIMRKLAPHVTTAVPVNKPRQEWTSTLPSRGKTVPAGWAASRDGSWRMYAENWAAFRDEVVERWVTDDFEEVTSCRLPIMWGTEADFQRNKHWLCRCACEGCVNVIAARRGSEGCVPD